MLPFLCCEAQAEDLSAYAVSVFRGTPATAADLPKSGNAGLYIGGGLILTATHVAGNPANPSPLGVGVENRLVPAQFVKSGRFEEVDLALLRVSPADLPDRMRRLPTPQLWEEVSPVGWQVLVVEPRGETSSSIASADRLPVDLAQRFPSLIADVTSTGNSGSAVFDAHSHCLMGIMSRKIELSSAAYPGQATWAVKYFIPAPMIKSFLSDVPSAQALWSRSSVR